MDENVKNNQISDEQLECVGGGNGTGDDYAKSFRDKILNAEQNKKQTDNLIADVKVDIGVGSVPSKEARENFKKRMEDMISPKKDKDKNLS